MANKRSNRFGQVAIINDHLYLSNAQAATETQMSVLGVTLIINATMNNSSIISNNIETYMVNLIYDI